MMTGLELGVREQLRSEMREATDEWTLHGVPQDPPRSENRYKLHVQYGDKRKSGTTGRRFRKRATSDSSLFHRLRLERAGGAGVSYFL